MDFNIEGFGLAMIVFAIVCIQVVTHKWVKKVTNCYFFWLGVGALIFAWLIAFRFTYAWQRLADHLQQGLITDLTDETQAFIVSKALLLDICPFMGLAMPLCLMVDPTRKAARTLAPLSLIGGLLIVFIDVPTSADAAFSAQYIFFGVGENSCYFLMHATNLILAVGAMLATPKYTWKGFVATLGAAIGYYGYVGIMMGALGITWYVSGLHINDWTWMGEYHPVAQFLGCQPQTAMIVGLIFCVAVCSGFIAMNDYVFHKGWFEYPNIRSKKWYLSWYDLDKITINRNKHNEFRNNI